MSIEIDSDLTLKLGFLHLEHCRVESSPDGLLDAYEQVEEAARHRFADANLGEHPVVSGVRRLFKASGIDPSRYRPSSEALVRRILKDQALYHVNSLVDINNICSIESLFPLGSYDRDRIVGDISIRTGANDESYKGIGRDINISGKLVSADAEGPFGSPIADSDRTKITDDTGNVLVLLYAPDGTEDSQIERTLTRYAALAAEFGDARSGEQGIVTAR